MLCKNLASHVTPHFFIAAGVTELVVAKTNNKNTTAAAGGRDVGAAAFKHVPAGSVRTGTRSRGELPPRDAAQSNAPPEAAIFQELASSDRV